MDNKNTAKKQKKIGILNMVRNRNEAGFFQVQSIVFFISNFKDQSFPPACAKPFPILYAPFATGTIRPPPLRRREEGDNITIN
jgi:hypothetical protein